MSDRRDTAAAAAHALRQRHEQTLRELDDLYRAATRELELRIRAAFAAGDDLSGRRLRAQLASALDVIADLDRRVPPIARRAIREAHQDGAAMVRRELRRVAVSMPETPGAFASVSREAVAQLQASLLDRLDAAHQTVGRRVQDVFARQQRHAAVRALLGAEGSPRAAAAHLEAQLRRQGMTAFVDRAGREWSLEAYSRMAARTVTREAVVQGSMDRMAANGITLARVSTHADACSVCQPFEGRIVTLDGSTDEFDGSPTLSIDEVPPFHPNCRHSLSPVAPGIEQLKRELSLRQDADDDG